MTTVADQLAFEQWPEDQQRVARAALYLEIDALKSDIENDVRGEVQGVFDEVRARVSKLQALAKGVNEAMTEARDVARDRKTRQARWATVTSGLVEIDAQLKALEKLL